MDFFILSSLNGLSYGLLLFMLSSGLTLIFSMMGVMNFAHASFYMWGAYLGYAMTQWVGFWPSLLLAPLISAVLGAGFERFLLRRVHALGHLFELLITFGLSYVMLELVQLVWGRTPVDFLPPTSLRGPAFTLISSSSHGLQWLWGAAPPEWCSAAKQVVCSPFPATRAFMMTTALLTLLGLAWLLKRTRIGLIVQSALTHPRMTEALGHNVPRIFMGVFGAGAGLAGLAGVLGGSSLVTEPGMAATVGSVMFVVVVVGGLGSLRGAFAASLLIGVLQTFAVGIDVSVLNALQALGWMPDASLETSLINTSNTSAAVQHSLFRLSVSQMAPMLPYLLMVLVLIFRPQGLMGKRSS
jgi:branched-chain amino acid transport system permease protein